MANELFEYACLDLSRACGELDSRQGNQGLSLDADKIRCFGIEWLINSTSIHSADVYFLPQKSVGPTR